MITICIVILIILVSIPVVSCLIDHIRTKKQQESLKSNDKEPAIKVPDQKFGATILQRLADEDARQKIKSLNKKEK